jgi:flagellar hook protein FlgE
VRWYNTDTERVKVVLSGSDKRHKENAMNNINTIGGSALQAYGVSLRTAAHNVANLNTEGFTASRATFQGNEAGGVSVAVSNTGDSVDISREAISLLSDKNGFKANLNALKTADEMTKELLNIKG